MPANVLRPKDAYIHPPGAQPGTPTNAGRWQDVADSPIASEACSVALLEMNRRQKAAASPDAAINAYKMEGAWELVAILLNLGEPDVPVAAVPEKKLQPV